MLPLSADSNNLIKSSYSSHWGELYRRLLRVSLAYLGLNALLWCFYDKIWAIILAPLERATGVTILILSLSSPFFHTLQLMLWLSFCLIMPYAIFEIASFIFPGLHQKEQFITKIAGTLFIAVFYLGQWFCWSSVLPWSLSFFISFNKHIAQPFLDFDHVVAYCLSLHQAFFVLAAWPTVLLLLLQQGVISQKSLLQIRGHIYVGSFILGMLLTPPDCLAQCCIAIPLITLYELVVLLSSLLQKKKIDFRDEDC